MSAERIAVVGGGVFGVTAAVQLARSGHQVVLFERADTLLSAASRANQRRLHRGYHYPRGMETATAALRSVKAFEAEYGPAVHRTARHYVAIARHRSLVTAEQYTAFCDAAGLAYREEYPAFLRRSEVEVSLRIEEALLDLGTLRRLCRANLDVAGVDVRLRTPADAGRLAGFDHVVLASYAALNQLRPPGGSAPRFQFEVCEKPLVLLPPAYRGTSLVIMDGPFMCLDPVPRSDSHLLGNVDHAIHATTIGPYPLVPRGLAGHLDRGLVRRPTHSRFAAFAATGEQFMAGFAQARYLGSYFTVRAVLPDLDATDDRPTLVRRLDERTTAVFGGKITTCVDAAHQLTALLTPAPAVPVP